MDLDRYYLIKPLIFSLHRQFVLLYRIMTVLMKINEAVVFQSLQQDFDRSGEKGQLGVLYLKDQFF